MTVAGSRYEIIDGELFVTRCTPHSVTKAQAGKHLCATRSLVQSKPKLGECFSKLQALFLLLLMLSFLMLSGLASERLANGVDEAGHLIVAPELMVEVLSPGELNEQRDKEVKLKLYSLHGVQEYWIINWQLKTLEVYRRSDAQLQLVATLP